MIRRDVRLERTYPHPRALVWRALTEPELIAKWLMDNDFAPEVGHRFTLRTDPAPGFDGVVHCEVLEVEPEERLRFSWVGGPVDTTVTFELEALGESSTRLRVCHAGFAGVKAALVSLILGAGSKRIYGRLLPGVLDEIAGEAGGGDARGRADCRMSPWQWLVAQCARVVPGREGRADERSKR